MADSPTAKSVDRRLIVTVPTPVQATVAAHAETLCRAQGVRCRTSAEIGRRSTLLAFELRGAESAIAAAEAKIGAFMVALPPPAPLRRRWPRAAVAATAFAAGAAAVLLFYWLVVRAH